MVGLVVEMACLFKLLLEQQIKSESETKQKTTITKSKNGWQQQQQQHENKNNKKVMICDFERNKERRKKCILHEGNLNC